MISVVNMCFRPLKYSSASISLSYKAFILSWRILLVTICALPILHAQEDHGQQQYFSTNVEVFHQKDSVLLTGTLSAPDSNGTFPLAVFISGSGPQDRFSTIGKHQPFLVLSKRLNEVGVATLSFDDRGAGESTGSIFTNTMQQELEDHQLILDAAGEIASNNKISFSKTGLIGHSQGGMIALELSQSNELDFYILLATPFENGMELMLKQKKNFESFQADLSEEEVDRSVNNMREIYEFVIENEENDDLDSLLFQMIQSMDSTNMYTKKVIDGLVYQLTKTSILDIIKYDPMEADYSFDSPTLFIYGGNDLQVSPAMSIENLDKLIKDNDQVEYVLFSALNHLFQRADKGTPMEYFFIDETINEMALQVVTEWVSERVE